MLKKKDKKISIKFFIQTYRPENVKRLYDLVQVKDESVKVAFYHALRDTLVADNLDQATRIAYPKVINLDIFFLLLFYYFFKIPTGRINSLYLASGNNITFPNNFTCKKLLHILQIQQIFDKTLSANRY